MIKLIGKIRSLSIKSSMVKNHRPSNNQNQTQTLDLEDLMKHRKNSEAYKFFADAMIETSDIDAIAALLDRLESVEKFETPEPFLARIIRSYGVAGRFGDAIEVFSRIPRFRCVPSCRSLDSLLRVLCERDETLRFVPDVLIKSRAMGIRIEESSFRILVGALCRIGGVGQAVEVLKCMISDGYYLDGKICSSILLALCVRKDELSLDGVRVFCFLRELRRLGFRPSLVDYKNVIDVLVKDRRVSEALKVLEYIKGDGIKPDIVYYNTILSGFVEEGKFEEADKLFDELLVLGLVPDIHTYNAYVQGLCKQNDIDRGLFTISAMEELGCKPNTTTYNLIVEAMCEKGMIARAKKIVSKMGSKGVGVNSQTRMILLEGIFGRGDINGACQLMEKMLKEYSCNHCSAYDEVISLLCRSGKVGKASEMLEKMVRENVGPGAKAWESLLLRLGSEINLPEGVLMSLLSSGET